MNQRTPERSWSIAALQHGLDLEGRRAQDGLLHCAGFGGVLHRVPIPLGEPRRQLDLDAHPRPTPIQMCDALSSNTAGDFEALVANCISHARRRYVDVAEDFPDECRFVLETLREVYKNDAVAKKQELSAAQRLALHKAESGPLMAKLEQRRPWRS